MPKKVTGIRLSEKERQALEREAKELGISLSEYVRMKLGEPPQLTRIETKIDEIKKIVEKK